MDISKISQPVGWRVARIGVLAACSAAVAAVMVTVIPIAQATPLRRTPRLVSSSTGSLSWKPRLIVYSGDGAAYISGTRSNSSHITWTRWGTRQGLGRGIDWHNTCTPNCAQGRYVAYPVKIHVYRPRRVAGHLVFTRMTTTFTDGFPPYRGYRHHSVTYKVINHGGALFWSIP